jgi:hypothetical protein
VMDDGTTARVQLTREQTAELGLTEGQEVYVHPPESKVIGRADEHQDALLGASDDDTLSEAVV